MAAVTTFVARRPSSHDALRFGVRWGAGHSAAIFALGGVLIVLGRQIPAGVARGLEFGVGALLLALGLWLLWGVFHARAHSHIAAGDGHFHSHGSATFGVGIAHGIAGTAPLVALLPMILGDTGWGAAAYLVLFGVGTIIAMGLYAVLVGAAFRHAAERSALLIRGMRTATALASTALGVMWMHGAVA